MGLRHVSIFAVLFVAFVDLPGTFFDAVWADWRRYWVMWVKEYSLGSENLRFGIRRSWIAQ